VQLPAPLEPWRAWLALFSPELVAPLSDLLMRLQPLTGKLGHTALSAQDLPTGVGNIVRRGSYERMLLTEWAFADTEPDEFIRRAANGELLFTGPEPDGRKNTKRSVVIFDAGPAQLGEPRIAHIVFFILLARRAEEANAMFQWGVWQRPGVLHEKSDLSGLKTLLNSRSLRAATSQDTGAWDGALNADIDDCWLIGANANLAPLRAKSQVFLSQAWMDNQLEVTLSQPRGTRTFLLDLPDPGLGVRILRQPFEPIAAKGKIRQKNGRSSLKQPPRFAIYGPWLAVPQLDGGTAIFHIPQSTKAEAGKYRVEMPLAKGTVLAAGVFKKNLSYVMARDDELVFCGFPGKLFGTGPSVKRPDMTRFRAPPSLARWLQLFYLYSSNKSMPRESVVVLDIDGRLVCWELSPESVLPHRPFDQKMNVDEKIYPRQIAAKVLGASQIGSTLFFGCKDDDGFTGLYKWHSPTGSPEKIRRIPRDGQVLLFGQGAMWMRKEEGALALRLNDTEWWVGTLNNAETTLVNDNSDVLGVVKRQLDVMPGLVVLHPSKLRIELCVGKQRYTLVNSLEPIGQASVDPITGRLAWITAHNKTLFVRGIDDEKPLLIVTADEVEQ